MVHLAFTVFDIFKLFKNMFYYIRENNISSIAIHSFPIITRWIPRILTKAHPGVCSGPANVTNPHVDTLQRSDWSEEAFTALLLAGIAMNMTSHSLIADITF